MQPEAPLNANGVCPNLVRFDSDDMQVIEEWSDYAATALSCGSSAIVAATRPHLEAILSRLQNCRANLFSAVEEGRFQALDAAETLSRFLANGQINERRFKEIVGGAITRAAASSLERDGRAVVFGEMVALLWADGQLEAAIALERLWNVLAQSHTFTLRCAYPHTAVDEDGGTTFRRICAEHSAVLVDGAMEN